MFIYISLLCCCCHGNLIFPFWMIWDLSPQRPLLPYKTKKTAIQAKDKDLAMQESGQEFGYPELTRCLWEWQLDSSIGEFSVQQVRWTAMEKDPWHQFGASTCMPAHPYKQMYVPCPKGSSTPYNSHQLAQTHKPVGTLHTQNLPTIDLQQFK